MNKPIAVAGPPEGFRERVLALTLSKMKRRGRLRRGLMLCTVAGAYAIGVFSAGWLVAPKTAAPPSPPLSTASSVADARTPSPGDGLPDAEREALNTARQSPEQRREALRAAGNRWLDEYGDIARATQFYGRFLDTTPANELGRFDPNDTWLLRTLRCARLQENVHEKESI